MSLVNFQVTLEGEITELDRKMLVKVADIIEAGVVELEEKGQDLDYQKLLNFVMDVNAQYRKYILVKVSDKVKTPHISVIKQHLQDKKEDLKRKLNNT